MVWARAGAQRRLWPQLLRLDSGWPDRAVALAAAALLVAAALPLLMSGPEEATEAAAVPAAGDPSRTAGAPETIVAGYGGVTFTHASDVRFLKPSVTDLTVHGVDWIGRPFKSPVYYGLRAIRWPAASRFGGMLDFTHAKAISVRDQSVRLSGTRQGRAADGTATIGDTFRHLEFSHGHNMLTLNGLMRLGQLAPRLRPYVGGGLGVSIPHTEVQFLDEPQRTYEYQVTGPVGQALAGIEIALPRLSIFIEYKFSLAPYWAPMSGRDGAKGNAFIDIWGQLGRWWQGEAPALGVLSTRLATHHLVAGVGLRHGGGLPRASP